MVLREKMPNRATLDLSGLTITELPDDAFYNTPLTSISIPKNVTLIDYGAFGDCKKLGAQCVPPPLYPFVYKKTDFFSLVKSKIQLN